MKTTYEQIMEKEGLRDLIIWDNEGEESTSPNGFEWTSEDYMCLYEYPFEVGHFYSVVDRGWEYGFEFFADEEEEWCATNMKDIKEVCNGETWAHVNVSQWIYKYLGNGEFEIYDAYENTYTDKYYRRIYEITEPYLDNGSLKIDEDW